MKVLDTVYVRLGCFIVLSVLGFYSSTKSTIESIGKYNITAYASEDYKWPKGYESFSHYINCLMDYQEHLPSLKKREIAWKLFERYCDTAQLPSYHVIGDDALTW